MSTARERHHVFRGLGEATAAAARPIISALRPADNRRLYLRDEVIREWRDDRDLQPPEAVVLDRLGPWLRERAMLDVGVGSGRTAWSFAPAVASYVGVDYSPPMIEDSRRQVGDALPNATFAVHDARDLSAFATGAFDFVLFSFNGLDLVDHEDRLLALRELHRVCAPGGRFCMSSHSLAGVSRLFRLNPEQRASLYRRSRGFVQQAIFRHLNPSQRELAGVDHALIREQYLDFRSTMYYVRPQAQLDQLAEVGFTDVEVYGYDGRMIDADAADAAPDLWLTYLASRTANGAAPAEKRR